MSARDLVQKPCSVGVAGAGGVDELCFDGCNFHNGASTDNERASGAQGEASQLPALPQFFNNMPSLLDLKKSHALRFVGKE